MISAQSTGFTTPSFSNVKPLDISRQADIQSWALLAGDEYMGTWIRQVAGKFIRKLAR